MRSSIAIPPWCAAALPLALYACGTGGTTEPPPDSGESLERPTPAAMTLVSGDNQEGVAGLPLPEALVVRVTTRRGYEMSGVPVVWRVATGAGLLFDLDTSDTTGTVVLRTRSGVVVPGAVAVGFIPTEPGRVTVTAEADGLPDDVVTFRADVDPFTFEWPAVAGAALTYERDTARSPLPPFEGRELERYVLHASGDFELQFYDERGFFALGGTYTPRNGLFPLRFADDVRWHATGRFDETGCLVVHYSLVAELVGFMDGVFCPRSEAP